MAENKKLKIAVERKERQLVDAGELLDAWRFKKDDLQRLLREYEVRNEQQAEELNGVQMNMMKEMRLRQAAQREKCLHHVEAQDMKRRMQKMTRAFQKHIAKSKGGGGTALTPSKNKKKKVSSLRGAKSNVQSPDTMANAAAAHAALEAKRLDALQVAALRAPRRGFENDEVGGGGGDIANKEN